MSVIFWNCRGAGSSDFLSHAKELTRWHKLDMFIVAEPRISGLAADKMIRKLQFDNYSKIDAQGFSGGIWILWRSSIGTVQVLDKFGQGLSILINNGQGFKLVLTAIYASPTPLMRECLWSYLSDLDGMDNVPWLLIGDFNQVISNSEKQGGIPECERRMDLFRGVLEAQNLIDIEAVGCRYTWSNNHPLSGLIKKRLDRVLCNHLWRLSFPEACVKNLARTKSDHCPILLSLFTTSSVNRSARPFRFEMAWLSHASFAELLKDNWTAEIDLHVTLSRWRTILQKWNCEVFGNIFKRKRRLLARIEGAQKAMESQPNSFLFQLENELVADYNQVLLQEEMLWYQKSRSNWVQLGDRNTKYFHTKTLIKRSRNKITMLKLDDGQWCMDQNILKERVSDYFRNLYMDDGLIGGINDLCPRARVRLSEEQVLSLVHIPQENEIRTALKSMAPFKAPGMDGFQAGFYQANWEFLGMIT
ncbi:hypothetical protein REPUB_Repub06bG0192700 [Reevesia pubescens]